MSLSTAFALCFLAALGVRGWFFARSMLSGAPAVTSGEAAARTMMELAGLKPGMTAADLGSGSGRLLLMAAERGAHAVGIELDPFMVLESRLKAGASGHADLIEVRWGDLWSADVSGADVVFVFLTPGKMERLKKSLEGRMKPGALLVSNGYQLPGCAPELVDAATKVYAYRAPFKREP